MFWKAKVHIPRQLYANFRVSFYICRFFGIFPFTMERSKTTLVMKWSPWYALHGFLLALLIAITCFSLAVLDMITKEGAVIDTINNIDKFVWLFVAVFIMTYKFPQLCEYVKCINHVDSIIKINSTETHKWRLNWMAFVLLMHSVILYVLIVRTYVLLVNNIMDLVVTVLIRVNPISIHIWIGLAVEYMIQVLTNILSMRFVRLNEILNDHYINMQNEEKAVSRRFKITEPFESTDDINITTNSRLPSFKMTSYSKAEDIINLSGVYLKLMEAAQILNDLFGVTILIVMASALFQLVSTPYYLILSLQGKRRGSAEIILRLLKFSQQVLRVLFLTEPWYECMLRVETTTTRVCNLLSLNTGKKYRNQVDAFAKSVYLNQLNFSACGFFNIDRFLISTLIGTVTTYVCILLQAQEDDIE